MLRLSKKADYALMAMKHLVLRADAGSASAREIAESYDIPVELLAKVLQRLTREGLLASQQGTRGGYHLSRPARTISVADVIQAIDGPLTMTACSDGDDRCDQFQRCSVRDPLWRLKDRILDALRTCTLYEIATDTIPDSVIPLHVGPRHGPTASGRRPADRGTRSDAERAAEGVAGK